MVWETIISIAKSVWKVISSPEARSLVCQRTPLSEQKPVVAEQPPAATGSFHEDLHQEEDMLKCFERIFNTVIRISRKQHKLYKEDPLLKLDENAASVQQAIRGSGRKLFGGPK